MIELNKIDESVLEAINSVRARAYGVKSSETDKYPAVTARDQKSLRQTVRLERRVEFAKEGLRYMDLIRWKLATKALNTKNYGILYPADILRWNRRLLCYGKRRLNPSTFPAQMGRTAVFMANPHI